MSLAPLMGLPGRVKILIDRLTSTRAANLDNLNATVSSRAPESTALSSSTWTPTKAGYLDAAISGRASQASVDALPSEVRLPGSFALPTQNNLADSDLPGGLTNASRSSVSEADSDYVDVVRISGAGVIYAAFGYTDTALSTTQEHSRWRLEIDGVDQSEVALTSNNFEVAFLNGCEVTGAISVPFNSSFAIKCKKIMGIGIFQFYARYAYGVY